MGAKSTKGRFPEERNSKTRKNSKFLQYIFVDIGPKLPSMIPELQTKSDQYLNPHQTFMGEANLTDDEVK